MVTFFIILLIISQLICFYFIIILNTKVAKFNDLEVRQDKLIREMDDAISLYLLEMREENDRLIKELSNLKEYDLKLNEKNVTNLGSNSVNEIENTQKIALEKEIERELVLDQKSLIPKTIVKNAYNRHKEHAQPNIKQKNDATIHYKEKVEKPIENINYFEQQVVKLHQEGKSIEEIAKITQKGKTEIELLIKFHT